MAEQNNKRRVDPRRKRINRLKRIIVTSVCIFILIPNFGCLILFARLLVLNKKLDSIYQAVQVLSMQLSEEEGFLPDPEYFRKKEEKTSADAKQGEESGSAGSLQNDGEQKESQTSGSAADMQEYAHKVYLTFDDGPSIYTNEILDILDSYGVKATFFVIGNDTEENRQRIKRIVSEGHTLGMHSYSHQYEELYSSVDSFKNDFHKIQDYLYDVTGEKCLYYRFPGGSSNSVSRVDMYELVDFLKEEGVTFYDWNIASGDATSQELTVDEMVANSTQSIVKWKTSIILLHDASTKYATVEALPKIIEFIQAMDDTVILPITDDTVPVQHIKMDNNE